MRTRLPLVLLALGMAAVPALAQPHDPVSPRVATPFYVGGNLTYARAQGEFSDFVTDGFGGSAHGIVRLDRDGLLGVRLDLGALNYGNERMRVPLSSTLGGRVLVDLETRNNIGFAGVGPQIGVPNGALRPYVHGFAGVTYLFTESSVEGTRHDDEPFATTTNFDDATFAWGGGTGVYIPVRRGVSPISVDVGVRYVNGGRARYLLEGDIEDLPDNRIRINPRQSDTDLMTFHVGVSVGISR